MENRLEEGSPSVKPKRRRKSWVDQQSLFWFRFGRILVGLVLRFWVRRFRAFGIENVPRSGGVFLIANHTTGMDPFLVGYPVVERVPRGPGKIELFKNPVAGFFLRQIGMFPLRQNVQDSAAVRTMVELYRADKLVIVYPEGGRSESGELMPFLPDFARLVVKLKAKMVPVAVAGGKDLLPIGSYIPRPNTAVTVMYGEAFELTEFYGHKPTVEESTAAAAEMFRRVADLLALAQLERDKLNSRG